MEMTKLIAYALCPMPYVLCPIPYTLFPIITHSFLAFPKQLNFLNLPQHQAGNLL